MDKNQHLIDRGIRVAIGLAMLIAFWTNNHLWWGFFGIVPILTAITGWCPIYAVAGINTRTGAAPQGAVGPAE